jgi:hypothetical protein
MGLREAVESLAFIVANASAAFRMKKARPGGHRSR